MSVEGTEANDAVEEDGDDAELTRRELIEARRVDRRCGVSLGVDDQATSGDDDDPPENGAGEP
jgi:hypothetical protein